MTQLVKIVVYVPVSAAPLVRTALAESGAGHIGRYSDCSFSVQGIGRFKPLTGAHPAIGRQNQISEVAEERIETVCPADQAERVVRAVTAVHPYEELAIDLYPLLSSS